ncbi:MAG: hypothetical protein R2748_07560 [Bryobacterales bacterium]
MEKTKPYEELYDTLVDPYEMHNLAADPDYAARLETMRDALVDWMVRTGDVGLIPGRDAARHCITQQTRAHGPARGRDPRRRKGQAERG